jgi:hypothetical protein
VGQIDHRQRRQAALRHGELTPHVLGSKVMNGLVRYLESRKAPVKRQVLVGPLLQVDLVMSQEKRCELGTPSIGSSLNNVATHRGIMRARLARSPSKALTV